MLARLVLPAAGITAAMLLALAWAGAAAAATDGEARDAVAAVLAGQAYQRELPSGRPARPPAAVPPTARPPAPPPPAHSISPDLVQVARVLLWILAVVAALLLVVAVARRLPDLQARASRPSGAAEVQAAEPGAPPPDTPLVEIDRLARAGAYTEAIHGLLSHSLTALRSRTGSLAPSLTSREIVGGMELPPPARAALAEITSAVEVSHFGGRPAGPAEYRLCRASFDRFAAGFVAP